MLKDLLFGCLLLGGVALAGIRVSLDLAEAIGSLTPCQAGYRGAVPGSCTRPLATPALAASARIERSLTARAAIEKTCRGI